MRISQHMMKHLMPINNLLDVGMLQREFEPVNYGFSRETVTLEQLIRAFRQETGYSQQPPPGAPPDTKRQKM
jgi:hypothetical protein